MAKAIAKPLSFSTTLRNPHRMVDFLFCMSRFEGEILTNGLIHQIVKEILRRKIYYTMIEKQDEKLKGIYEGDAEFSDSQLEYIIKSSPQNHKEAGFDKGWPSRFDTWYELLKEFGFIYYKINEKIIITDSGKFLLKAIKNTPTKYSSWEYDEEIIKSAMLNSLAKYQTVNPYSKNSNSNNPLMLLLSVIECLKKKTDYKGISRKEISILICWPNNNAEECADFILKIRKKEGLKPSDEVIYDYCLSLLGVTHDQEKRFKMDQITGEAVDEYIRKMRITGIISLRGNGNYIDENKLEKEKIDYLFKNYNKFQVFDSETSYIKHMGSYDSNFKFVKSNDDSLMELKQKCINEYAHLYDTAKISDELEITYSKKGSKDPMLKLIDKPVRLEFLVSVLLCKRFGKDVVFPSYTPDDEGLPTSTAGGGEPDIVCEDSETISLIEVSLMRGRSDQINNEIIPISRHLNKYPNPTNKGKNALFAAPTIHEDTYRAAQFSRFLDKLDLYALTCDELHIQVNKSGSLRMLYSNVKSLYKEISI